MNITFGMRVANLSEVALLPSPIWPTGANPSDTVRMLVRRTFVNKCLAMWLEPLKKASFTPVSLPDPWGVMQRVVPLLHSYVGDDPECKDVNCTKSGKFPCERCLVPMRERWDVMGVFPARLEVNQKAECDRMQQDKIREGEYSTLPIPSCLWGFNFSDREWGSSTMHLPYEALHDADCGVWLYIVAIVKPYLQAEGHPNVSGECIAVLSLCLGFHTLRACARPHAGALREINARMTMMPRDRDFALPHCDGKYWPDHSRVQAKEHRNVMQAAPFLFHGISDALEGLLIA